jgi:hypothetical protein
VQWNKREVDAMKEALRKCDVSYRKKLWLDAIFHNKGKFGAMWCVTTKESFQWCDMSQGGKFAWCEMSQRSKVWSDVMCHMEIKFEMMCFVVCLKDWGGINVLSQTKEFSLWYVANKQLSVICEKKVCTNFLEEFRRGK